MHLIMIWKIRHSDYSCTSSLRNLLFGLSVPWDMRKNLFFCFFINTHISAVKKLPIEKLITQFFIISRTPSNKSKWNNFLDYLIKLLLLLLELSWDGPFASHKGELCTSHRCPWLHIILGKNSMINTGKMAT